MATPRLEQSSPLITIGAIRYLWIVVIGIALGLLVPFVPLPILAGVLVTLTAALLILHNPYWGLLAYIVVYLVRPQEIWITFGGQLPIEKSLAIAVLVATIVSRKVRIKNKIILGSTSKALFVFVGAIALSVPFSVWRGNAMEYLMEFVKIAIVFFLITQLCDTPRRVRIFIWVYLLCHLWLAGSTIYNYYTEPAYIRMGIQRAHGYSLTMGSPNTVAASLAFSIPFALLLIKDYRRVLIRAVLLSLAALSVYAVIFTGSRAGMVTLIALAIVFAFHSRHKFPALLAAVGILLSVWMVMPQMYQQRFMTMFTEEGEQYGAKESAKSRWRGLRLGVKMFLDRPIFGVGVGNYAAAWFGVYTIDGIHSWSQSHNMFAQLIAELGIVGLLTFVIFLTQAIRQNRRVIATLRCCARPPPDWSGFSAIATAVGITYILLLISGLFGHNLYRYNWYYLAGVMVAMEAIIANYQARQLSTATPSTASADMSG